MITIQMTGDLFRQETCSNILVHILVDLNLRCLVKTSKEWKLLDYLHLRIFKSTEQRDLERLVSSFWQDPVEPHSGWE